VTVRIQIFTHSKKKIFFFLVNILVGDMDGSYHYPVSAGAGVIVYVVDTGKVFFFLFFFFLKPVYSFNLF
jgi:hypothetical protein